MTIDTFRYTPARRTEVLQDLAVFGCGIDRSRDAFWEQLLNRPDVRQEAVLFARDGAGRLAVAFASRRPILDRRARMVFYLLPDRPGDMELDSALMRAMDRELAARGITRQVVSVFEDQAPLRALVQRSGFEPLQVLHQMGWQGDGTPLPERDLPGIELFLYEGGDAALDEELAGLWSRAFAGDSLYGALDGADVERLVRVEGAWMMVARDAATGRAVGASEASDSNFFAGIAVARSHWGRGVAESLAAATMNEFRRRGHSSLISLVRADNAPSVALHRRMGWRRRGSGEIFLGPPIGA